MNDKDDPGQRITDKSVAPVPATKPPTPPLSDTAVTASGGWCSPSEALYDIEHVALSLPVVGVQRGGFDYTDRRTQAEKAAAAAIEAFIARRIGDVRRAQIDAIDTVLLYAIEADEKYDVHIQYHPWKATRFVGISIEPRWTGYSAPIIHEHRDTYYWDEDGNY